MCRLCVPDILLLLVFIFNYSFVLFIYGIVAPLSLKTWIGKLCEVASLCGRIGISGTTGGLTVFYGPTVGMRLVFVVPF